MRQVAACSRQTSHGLKALAVCGWKTQGNGKKKRAASWFTQSLCATEFANPGLALGIVFWPQIKRAQLGTAAEEISEHLRDILVTHVLRSSMLQRGTQLQVLDNALRAELRRRVQFPQGRAVLVDQCA
jgi:hypothetical protein